jgi:hypothetical protein
VVFSPDGHILASSNDTVRLWGMNVDHAIQRICATTTNALTPHQMGAVLFTGPALPPVLPVIHHDPARAAQRPFVSYVEVFRAAGASNGLRSGMEIPVGRMENGVNTDRPRVGLPTKVAACRLAKTPHF